jgi:hypothetical protein
MLLVMLAIAVMGPSEAGWADPAKLVAALHRHEVQYLSYRARFDVMYSRTNMRANEIRPTQYDFTRIGTQSRCLVTSHIRELENPSGTKWTKNVNEIILNTDHYLNIQYRNEELEGVVGSFLSTDRHKDQSLGHRCNSFFILRFPSRSEGLGVIVSRAACAMKERPGESTPYILVAEDGNATIEIAFDAKLTIKRISIYEVNPQVDDPRVHDQLGKVYAFRNTCEVLQSRIINDVDVPIKIRSTLENRTEKRGTILSECIATYHEFTFNPPKTDTMFRPQRVIPNGTRVSVESEPQIEYEWWDGRIEKRIHRETFIGLAQHHFQRGYLGYGILIVACGSILIVGGLQLIKRKSMRGKV